MTPLPLADTGGTVRAWACGTCGRVDCRPVEVGDGARERESSRSREAAERCCLCPFCGSPVGRRIDPSGGRVCAACDVEDAARLPGAPVARVCGACKGIGHVDCAVCDGDGVVHVGRAPRLVTVESGTLELAAVDTERYLALRVGHSVYGHLGDIPIGDVAALRWDPDPTLLAVVDDLIAEASPAVPRASAVPEPAEPDTEPPLCDTGELPAGHECCPQCGVIPEGEHADGCTRDPRYWRPPGRDEGKW